MKYFLNVLFAFAFTWMLLCTAAEYVHYPPLRSAIFSISFHTYVFIWWIAFSFPKAVGQVLTLIANAVMQGLTFTVTNISRLLEHAWKYRAGQIIIGGVAAYIAYIIIF